MSFAFLNSTNIFFCVALALYLIVKIDFYFDIQLARQSIHDLRAIFTISNTVYKQLVHEAFKAILSLVDF